MNLLLFSLITIFLVFGGTLLYRFDGRKSLFNIDFVQFLYSFLILPLIFVSMKVFLYQTLSEMAVLSARQLFAVDTLLSVLFLYFSAAMAIHTITKSFSLHQKTKPSFDIWHVSEYLHMWWSHVVMYVLALCIFTVFSITNLIFPLTETELARQSFYASLFLGSFIGVFLYTIIWNTKLGTGNFLAFMKIIFAFFFTVHASAYIRFRPDFSAEYLVFWMMFTMFFTTVLFSFFLEKSRHVQKWRTWFQPGHWGK